jgi:Protein of unknown function (DUF4239)
VLLFLTGLPLWIAIPLLVVLPAVAALLGPLFIRRWIGFERLASNNEIAGFKFATVGVIYAVLVAFAIIVVWEKFNQAQTVVVEEAGAAATLYRLTDGPEPAAAAVRAALTKYLELAVDRDWPAMAKASESSETTKALNALYTSALPLARNPSLPQAVPSEMFKQMDSITEARRTRLHLAGGTVPLIIWLVLSSGAVLTVVFTFFFATKNLPAQMMMTGILALLVFMALLVIISIDRPFTGPTKVDSDPLRTVLADFSG